MQKQEIEKIVKSSKLPKAKQEWAVAMIASLEVDFARKLAAELPGLVKAAERKTNTEKDTEQFFRFSYSVKGIVEEPETVKAETKLGYSERTVNKGHVIMDTRQIHLQLEEGELGDLRGLAPVEEDEEAA